MRSEGYLWISELDRRRWDFDRAREKPDFRIGVWDWEVISEEVMTSVRLEGDSLSLSFVVRVLSGFKSC